MSLNLWQHSSGHKYELKKFDFLLSINLVNNNSWLWRNNILFLLLTTSRTQRSSSEFSSPTFFGWADSPELGKVFNCYLPEAYWYTYSGPDGTDEPKVWKTTKCYIKSTVFWEYVSYLLFIFYAICKFLISWFFSDQYKFRFYLSNWCSRDKCSKLAKKLQNDQVYAASRSFWVRNVRWYGSESDH